MKADDPQEPGILALRQGAFCAFGDALRRAHENPKCQEAGAGRLRAYARLRGLEAQVTGLAIDENRR